MSDPVPSSVTAVVVAFNSAHVLPACLKALSAEGVRAIVVDNASADTSVAVARRHGARVIRNDANQGYGRANNHGVAAADTPYVLICNPDLVARPGMVAALLQAVARRPKAALFGPRLIEPDGRENERSESLLSTGPVARRPEGDTPVAMLTGACLLMRRELFMEMGGFDPNIFLFYEDDDLCRRLRDRGYDLVRVRAAAADHARGGSCYDVPGIVRLSRFHQARSRVYVARKYGLNPAMTGLIVTSALKYLLAVAAGHVLRRERYGGTLAGAWSALAEPGPATRPVAAEVRS